MTRRSPGSYVLAFGLIVVAGGIALAFLPGPGWLLIGLGSVIAGVGALLLLLDRSSGTARASEPRRPPADGG